MLRHSPLAVVLWLFAIALLPVRMANAHLHLCLDGQDLPVAVHMEDVPTHHGVADTPGGHNDVDLEVSASATAKKAESIDDLDWYVLGAYFVALLAPDEREVLRPLTELRSNFAPPVGLPPPPRGPPSLASL